jgi:hypothetical protein
VKISEKILKSASIGYLYGNGKLVIIHRQPHKQAGEVQWASIHDASDVKRDFTGRLVLHSRGLVRLMLAARCVRAQVPTLENGSENTRRLGIPYGYVSVSLGEDSYSDAVHFALFTNFISCDLTYQPENEWTEQDNAERWAGYRVAVRS